MSSIDSSGHQDQGSLGQQWTEIVHLPLELGRSLSASLAAQGMGWDLPRGTPSLQGCPDQPLPRAGWPLETSDCGPWVLCTAGTYTLPLFSGQPSFSENPGLFIRGLVHIYMHAVYTKLSGMEQSALSML